MYCRHAQLAALLAATLALTACGPDEEAPPPSVLTRSANVCDTLASRCAVSEVDTQTCKRYSVCAANLVRPEVADAVFACQAAQPCGGGSSERCYLPEVAGFMASPRWATYESACLARLSVCAAEGVSYLNDFCQKPYSAATDAVLDAMQACLDGPCAAVTGCVATLTAGLCADECAGLVSGACYPPITLRVDVEGAVATAVSGAAAEALTCSSSAGSTNCESLPSLTPGTYAYDVTAGGRTMRVSIVVGPDPGGCFSCGFDPAMERVTFRGDGGM